MHSDDSVLDHLKIYISYSSIFSFYFHTYKGTKAYYEEELGVPYDLIINSNENYNNNKNIIFGLTAVVIILSAIGISKLEVENSFINYFNKNTEIYKGMKLIDEELGGKGDIFCWGKVQKSWKKSESNYK